MNWRLILVRFVTDAVLIVVVIWLLPGLRTGADLSLLDIVVITAIYGLLNAFVRPALDLLLMPFLVQSYGLVLVLVDVIVFALLVLLVGDVEADRLVTVIVGGLLLGLLHLGAVGLLGLTPPVLPEGAGRYRPETPGRVARMSAGASERLRLLRIRTTIRVHAIDAAFDGSGFISRFRRRMQMWIWRPEKPLEQLSNPMRFRLLLQDLGPTYVKIGQIISSQARTLPSDWEEELEKLQSDVRPFPYEYARQRIVDELGAPPEELYAEFSTEPMAAASLAQVHRAVLLDGREVAVKVQRPGIHGQLRNDVRILLRMSQALERRARWAADMDLTGVIYEFGTTLLRELDYTIEAYNARRLSRILEPIEGVRVPDVIYERSSSGVLTLEFIHGVKSTDTAAIDTAGLDREVLANNTVRAAVKMMMIDGFFHADPHPGNVFVDLKSGDLTMLDTGMVGELTFLQRVKLGSLLLVIRNGDVPGLAQTLKSLSTSYRETDDEAYYKNFVRKLTPYLDPPPGQQMEVMAKVLPQGLDILHDAGYRLDPQLTLAMKAMAQAEAITTSLVPEWTGTDFMTRAFDALVELLPGAITADAIKDATMRQASFVLREAVEQMPSIQEGLLRWLGVVKKGGLTVELDTSGLDKQLQSLRGIAQMLMLGILVVGLVIGSAIAAGIGGLEGSALAPVTDLAAIVFAISAVVGGVSVIVISWRLIRRDRQRHASKYDRL